jgi:hypothetical protein
MVGPRLVVPWMFPVPLFLPGLVVPGMFLVPVFLPGPAHPRMFPVPMILPRVFLWRALALFAIPRKKWFAWIADQIDPSHINPPLR